MDIGANLVDPQFQGIYHSKQKHQPDIQQVIQRSSCKKIIITVTNFNDIKLAQQLVQQFENLYYTIGLHPTHANDDLQPLFEAYEQNKNDQKLLFIGEIGLDYERLTYASKERQIQQFKKQLEYFQDIDKCLFIHNRGATMDVLDCLKDYKFKCIFHSFDGSIQELNQILSMGYEIGFNGCSLRTEELLKNVVEVPIEKLHLESDCPWCDIRATHASFKHIKTQFQDVKKPEKWTQNLGIKGRNEPRGILLVAEVIASIKNISVEQVINQTYKNSCRILNLRE
ncbi:Deoxyribonuclease, TatD family [Spironucleus salmonicida]|uniref:Deoxyribonuclease, TatD family n=1 Tax=Spironucleus salmonicida TaxID=348837 RepID=V6LE75_9EUKA|nr:Deoxyribonuclease, TatD family [Spironucleus salmonicida]|eukprot:EST41996.1 Deoxyribonuclease, TatD family [Spironucleus salmonicida]